MNKYFFIQTPSSVDGIEWKFSQVKGTVDQDDTSIADGESSPPTTPPMNDGECRVCVCDPNPPGMAAGSVSVLPNEKKRIGSVIPIPNVQPYPWWCL